MGMGQAGIVLALDTFADATGDRTFRRTPARGLLGCARSPGTDAGHCRRGRAPGVFETGFLNGSAGAAFVFLERYAHDHARVDLETAKRLLGWVNDHAEGEARGLRWPPPSTTPQPCPASSSAQPGSPGSTCGPRRQPATAPTARSRGVQASGCAAVATAGSMWHELPGDATTPVHVGLDSGTAGIGWVLEDLARAGLDAAANRAAARSTLAALSRGAAQDRLGTHWYESHTGGKPLLAAEPSWHWGSAGIAAFAARLAGWSGQGPGGQRIGSLRSG